MNWGEFLDETPKGLKLLEKALKDKWDREDRTLALLRLQVADFRNANRGKDSDPTISPDEIMWLPMDDKRPKPQRLTKEEAIAAGKPLEILLNKWDKKRNASNSKS